METTPLTQAQHKKHKKEEHVVLFPGQMFEETNVSLQAHGQREGFCPKSPMGSAKLTGKHSNLTMLTTNAADLRMKTKSLKNILLYFSASIFSVQETHFKKKGKFTHDNFAIFESIRKKEGGGSMLGIHVSLQPVLIEEYSDIFELLVVEISLTDKNIRIITGYGPQETWSIDVKMKFFSALEIEIAKAANLGKGIIVMGDMNSKLGPKYVKHDPKEMSENGKVLSGIIERNALTVVNGMTTKCDGTITRERSTINGIEKSVIDFVIVSSNMVKDVVRMTVDEKRRHVLTKLLKTKKGIIKKESDHNTIITEIQCKPKPVERTKISDIFNLNDKECQKSFKREMDNTSELLNIVEKDEDVDKVTKKFLKRLDGFLHKHFRKIRVTHKVDKKLENLYTKKTELKSKEDAESKKLLDELEIEMAEIYSENMANKIKEELKGINCEDGGWNPQSLWKLRSKLSPRPVESPTAMENKDGILLTDPVEIQKEALKYYENLFQDLPMDTEYVEVQKVKENMCKMRLRQCAENKTSAWTLDDLDQVLKQLRKGTSRDPYGYNNELFKNSGKDLKLATLTLMNKIKSQQKVPKALQLCNITSIYKNKGLRRKYNSYRGIFRITVLRSILDRLIYNDMYETLDSNLSDCNVGNRKSRNIRDNLFVMNAVLNSTKHNPEEPVDIGIYDVEKCFDTMWAQEALNDVYDLGFQNDKLPLINLTNKSASIAVKSSTGLSSRSTIENTIMQGTVWAGMLCTSTMDKLGKLVYNNPHISYKYKGKVVVPPLQMIDDVLTISKCGCTSVAMNSLVNSFMSSKKLRLNKLKCAKIHVGRKSDMCPQLMVQNHNMKTSEQEKYLGDMIHQNGKQHATIVDRISKGYGILANITAILTDIPLGHRRVEIGLELRQALWINGILHNSEVWQDLTEKDKKDIEKIDHDILRLIVQSHAKAPIEQLYLETSTLSVTQIISVRRMIYMQTILQRAEGELILNVFEAMKAEPLPGDWYSLVKSDFEFINLVLTEDEIRNMTPSKYKSIVKNKMREAAFTELKKTQSNHEKGSLSHHENLLKPQQYLLTNKISNKQKGLLFNLKCQSVRGFRENFSQMYFGDIQCRLCNSASDSQNHLMLCPVLKDHFSWDQNIKYTDIYGTLEEQVKVTSVFSSLMEVRDLLLLEEDEEEEEEA